MLAYADTSALVAYFYPNDIFTIPVMKAAQREAPDFVYWSFLRFELRHVLRMLRGNSDGEIGWRALRAAERTSSRLRWQSELTVDKVLDAAEELSAEKALEADAGSSDILHVVAARRIFLISGLDEFWTCDKAQAVLAKLSGLRTRLIEAR